MRKIDVDDKDLVIVALTIIACVAMFRLPTSSEIVVGAISGLAGIAVGRKKNDNGP